jgi:hypothetical protein
MVPTFGKGELQATHDKRDAGKFARAAEMEILYSGEKTMWASTNKTTHKEVTLLIQK